MKLDKLYRVKKEDFEKLEHMLTKCFAKDPLYMTLIPDESTRERLMPELFQCDVEELFSTCEIYADSPEINGFMIVSDETEAYNPFKYYLAEAAAVIKTDGFLIKEDHSLKTLWNFVQGKDYLNSSWTDQLHKDNRLHMIYLAVDPDKQHHGIAKKLLEELIEHADKNGLMISLETHNEKNVTMYQHFGFKIFGVMKKHFDLKQYCMVREI